MTGAQAFWEDFKEGAVDHIGPHIITRDEIIAFASQYDPQPFHLDEEAAKDSMLGQLCASGWHVCSLLWKIASEDAKTRETFTDHFEIRECRWKLPVFPGDALTIHRTCLEKIPPRDDNDGAGICLFRWDVFDAAGNKKTEIHLLQGVRRREARG